MRKGLCAGAISLLALAGSGCNARDAGHEPLGPSAPDPAPLAPAAVAPAVIVYTASIDGHAAVLTAIEDGSLAPTQISASSVDTTFAGSLPGRRVLLAELAADGSITALATVLSDGSSRAAAGGFAAGVYKNVAKIQAEGGAIVVELTRMTGGAGDVFALHAGADPALLAPSSALVTTASGRAAVLSSGDLRSVAIDGGAPIALGAGGGHDRVAEVRGDRLLLTTGDGAAADVRWIGIDGSGEVDLGKVGVEDVAFGLTKGGRIVFTRRAAEGAALVSATLDGKDERALAAADLDARPVAISPDDQVIFGTASGALLAVAAGGGAARVLDAAAGQHVKVGSIDGARVIYTGDGPQWPALRAAKLDGSGTATLCDKTPWLPFFSAIQGDRVVFYRSLAGQLEGGRVYSVKLDGSDLRPIGVTIVGGDGKALAASPADQDFEAITRQGRIVLEAEFDSSDGSKLVVGTAESAEARMLGGAAAMRFAGLLE